MCKPRGNYLYSNSTYSIVILIAVNLIFLVASGFNVISIADTSIITTPNTSIIDKVDILSTLPSSGVTSQGGSVNILTNEAISSGGNIPLNKPTVNQKEKPRVLIYHTHTAEAYLKDEAERKSVSLVGRTTNPSLSVCTAGVTLTNKLTSLGVNAVHNTSNNEKNGYNSSYSMSRANVKDDIKKYGKFTAYIDVHRDAYIKGVAPTVNINGIQSARIMIVLGKKSPHYEKNLALSEAIKAELDKIHPELCIKILKVDATYNQDLDDNFILVEIGNNGVTVEEAQNASEFLASAIANVLL